MNPFTSKDLPIFIIPDLDVFPAGSDSLLGIPDLMTNGKDIAKDLSLDLSDSILDADGITLKNSGPFSGLDRAEARKKILDYAKEHRLGGHLTSSKIKDWLISRQR